MFDDLVSGQTTNYLLAIGIVAVGLLGLFFVLWLIRKRSNSTFIRGGKNRQPRLAVLDAAAVDTRRRLVLVRRDGVEHLILIGGPTDVVIESGIAQSERSLSRQEAAVQVATPDRSGKNAPLQRADLPARQAEPSAAFAPPPPTKADEPAKPFERTEPSAPASGKHSASPEKSTTMVAPSVAAAVSAVPDKDAAENALDALDAARSRVLSTEKQQQAAASRISEPAKITVTEKPAKIADAYFEDEETATFVAEPTVHAYRPPLSGPASQISTPPASEPVSPRPTSASATSLSPPNRQQPGRSDFEAILEAELAEDFDIGDDLGIDLSDDAPDTGGDLSSVTPGNKAGNTPASPAKPEKTRDDTLEDEMNKLLGDLSRRN